MDGWSEDQVVNQFCERFCLISLLRGAAQECTVGDRDYTLDHVRILDRPETLDECAHDVEMPT